MPRPPRWTSRYVKDGMKVYTLSSWKYFSDFINQQLLQYEQYIFRGQSASKWKLESTLDRTLKNIAVNERPGVRNKHLENFKYAVRGRRGPNPASLKDENDWWALGQHHGLATPLLDWTESPFVALFFAFEDEDTGGDDFRAVWAISQYAIQNKSRELRRSHTSRSRPPICEIIRPMSDENSRLVSQRGLFLRGEDGVPIDSWIREHYVDDTHFRLMKLRIPDTERERCLRWLNQMNINRLSLFPDLHGASQYCNLKAITKKY